MDYLTFVSHSSQDTWVAQKIASDCEAIGVSTFLDEARIAVGARFEKEIINALRRANELIVLVTPWALKRPYIWMEIGVAWSRDIPIVILLHGLTPKKFQASADIPVTLKERNIISLNDFEKYLDELRSRFRTVAGGK